jgi:pimeloyl-ACP methyl ester carboxylesterase
MEEFLAPFRSDFRSSTERFVRGFFQPGSDSRLVERIAADMASAPPGVALSAMREAFAWLLDDAEGRLPPLDTPLWQINADPESRNPIMEENTVWIPDAGHFVAQQAPERFNRALRAIVDAYERATP